MKIIQVHNYYQQLGGEDAVVEAESALLRSRGDIVIEYYKSNDDITASGNKLLAIGSLLKASLSTLWNPQTYKEFRVLLKCEHPDIVHCHNTFPLISPSIYWACAKEQVPVVQTLHNYRLLCLNAFLFRQNRHEGKKGAGNAKESTQSPNPKAQSLGICELCVSKNFKWLGVRYHCYRNSLAGSLVVASVLFVHKLLGTWSKKVTAYIALTEFQKQKMIEGGIPGEKIFVKSNFIQITEEPTTKDTKHTKGRGKDKPDFESLSASVSSSEGNERVVENPYCLFVGRLSPEKGCDVLIRAWNIFTSNLQPPTSNPATAPQLLIVGDGPEREELEALMSSLKPQVSSLMPESIHFLGQQPKESVLSLMHNAQFLISPSVCYETFGLVVLEAGILKTPSIVGEPGTVAGLIHDGETGLLFPMGDEMQLAEKIEWAFSNPKKMDEMGTAARKDFESKYSAEENAKMLINIYEQALGSPLL